MIIEMLRWWYGTGWMQAVHRISSWTTGVGHTFSVSSLLRTLFSPWRRITSGGGRSIDAKMRDALDNFVSRCVGFTVRIIVLVAAGITSLGVFIAGVVLVIVWPALPPAVIYFAVRGIIG